MTLRSPQNDTLIVDKPAPKITPEIRKNAPGKNAKCALRKTRPITDHDALEIRLRETP